MNETNEKSTKNESLREEPQSDFYIDNYGVTHLSPQDLENPDLVPSDAPASNNLVEEVFDALMSDRFYFDEQGNLCCKPKTKTDQSESTEAPTIVDTPPIEPLPPFTCKMACESENAEGESETAEGESDFDKEMLEEIKRLLLSNETIFIDADGRGHICSNNENDGTDIRKSVTITPDCVFAADTRFDTQ